MADIKVRAYILKLERRVKILTAIVGLLITLFEILGIQLDGNRLADGKRKKKLLRAIGRARKHIALGVILKIIGLSSTRYHNWNRAERYNCPLDDLSSCPNSNPRRLIPEEVMEMRDMATSPEFRHVSTSTLAILAQRIGKVFASPATWFRYIREQNWRRPRKRIHPAKPTIGLRTEAPDATWHIDTTVIRLLDGTKAYLQAIIDNYSRRILAWRLSSNLEPGSTAHLLIKAYESRSSVNVCDSEPQSVMVDGGVENFNAAVQKLVKDGLLKLILAQTDISFSNSMIEAFWRVIKHQWLFLNHLDSIKTLRRLVEFYITEYNGNMPHSAFRGQTPDEMYYNTGAEVPGELAEARWKAMETRIEATRKVTCENCSAMNEIEIAA